MKVLIGCEESQTVCKAFRALGHEAYSCDLVPCSGGFPEWHIQSDVRYLLGLQKDPVTSIKKPSNLPSNLIYPVSWDLLIANVPCDHLAVSGARWFEEKRKDGRQRAAIEFFLDIWESPVFRIAIENPVGIMSGERKYLKKYFPDLYDRAKILPDCQYIQPYEYGHTETKKTCLWLKNLPRLIPTKNVYEEMMRLPAKKRNRVHHMPPSPARACLRAKTYPGWAAAMADQWGCL